MTLSSGRQPAGRPDARRSSPSVALALLFAGNLLNFYDRALPAVVLERIKADFALDDAQVGLLGSAFILFAAAAAIPLGRLADRRSRTHVAGWCLVVWSAFTAVTAVVSGFWAFFWARVGVGVAEAGYVPAAGSVIADLYPTARRARAASLFMLGFPIGTLLAYFTAGALAEAFDSWRAPFLLAGPPGVVIALLILWVREPRRGATDPTEAGAGASRPALRELRSTRSLLGFAIAFAGFNFAAYAIGTFTTPLLQRSYGLGLVEAATLAGFVIGVTGLLGLLVGGRVCDRAARRSASARVRVAAAALMLASPLAYLGLAADSESLGRLVAFLSLAYFFGIVYLAAQAPSVADVIRPELRASALAIVFATGFVLGGAAGPVAVGALSDRLARSSGLAAEAASAQGLQDSLTVLVPIAFMVAGIGMLLAGRHVKADRAAMLGTLQTLER